MKPRLNLRGKLLVLIFGIVTVLTGLSLAVIHQFVSKEVYRDLEEDLARTRSVFETCMSERALWLRSQSWVVAEDPRFVATLDLENPDFNSQARTVLREAQRFQNIVGSDRFVVTDRAGRVLADVDLLSKRGEVLTGVDTIAQALEGEMSVGESLVHARTYRMASVPVYRRRSIIGTLSVGFREALDEGRLLDDVEALVAEKEVGERLEASSFFPVLSLLRETREAFGADLVAVTDGAGKALGLIRRRSGYENGIHERPGLRSALGGNEWIGLEADVDRLFQTVVVPIWSQGEIIGSLQTGFQIDDYLAHKLRDMTHSEVSFLLNDRVIASSLPETSRSQLAPAAAGKQLALGARRCCGPCGFGEFDTNRAREVSFVQHGWPQVHDDFSTRRADADTQSDL